ncbi:SPOR domain-containing protein [Balneolaceae bacterium YR4-1]|uniref:SPOR domain-containing protein n=1 Tax=Halalkalibaculum roseum TaxID=2709311 RepID=A0A6M1SX02_9BACT|nr:SPOR domain-containing protein [Halalkalibaculum roseum]NGP76526.1 SPOR domain-containing protein [Halalkalibaculum roseum]
MNPFRFSFYFLVTAMMALLLISACSSTEQTRRGDERPERETTPDLAETARENLSDLLTRTRNRLSDIHFTQQHDVPEAFLKVDTTENTYNNPFEGYRIQILSSREVNVADSVSTQFRLWADTTLAGYTPKAYVFFKQPYYKVHVGDFQDRDKANNLSRIIKNKYPEAWVVHDRIDPSNVPADTVKIKLQENN